MIRQLYFNKPCVAAVPLYNCGAVEGYTQQDAALYASLRNIVQRQAALQKVLRGQPDSAKQSENQQEINEKIIIRNEQINNQLGEERGSALRMFDMPVVS